jgi:bacteriorhodopsin
MLFLWCDRPLQWSRMVAWTVTTPVLLLQVNGIRKVTWGNLNMNSAVVRESLTSTLVCTCCAMHS